MQTRYFPIDPDEFEPSMVDEPAAVLRSGGVVAFPTETVYGLGANADDPAAIRRLNQVKERPENQPLTYHLADREDVYRHVERIPRLAGLLMDRYWPGPLTLVIEARSGKPTGFRVPSHKVARELIRRSGVAVAGTSANPHNQAPATDERQVRAYFDGRIEAAIESGRAPLQQASAVVQIDGESYRIHREGIITHEMIHQLLMGRNILFICTGNSCRSPMAEALFKKWLAEKLDAPADDLRELGYVIHSAGTFSSDGGPASAHAVEAMRELSCDLSRHRTRSLTREMILAADRIFALGNSHLQQVLEMSPEAEGKVALLGEVGITDPIGGDLETYRQCAREIDHSIRRILENP